MKHHNKNNLSIGIALGIIILVGVWLLFFEEFNQPASIDQFVPKKEIEVPQIEAPQKEVKEEIILVIDNGQEDIKTFEAEFRQGMTAFDLLKNKAEELDLILETKIFDIGILVETIGDKKNGDQEKYWLYYVNDEMPMVAANKKEIEPGDKVEFKFEESKF